eukprot:scaffold476138_cov18-Prasinocladus_malaysianus.AAC.1
MSNSLTCRDRIRSFYVIIGVNCCVFSVIVHAMASVSGSGTSNSDESKPWPTCCPMAVAVR